jgi:hypothetical protein
MGWRDFQEAPQRELMESMESISIARPLIPLIPLIPVEAESENKKQPPGGDGHDLSHYCEIYPGGCWCSVKLPGSDYPAGCLRTKCEHYQSTGEPLCS